MAEEINAIVNSHIDVQMRVIDVVSAYARGDLSPTSNAIRARRRRSRLQWMP
jgi:hypothetical protein